MTTRNFLFLFAKQAIQTSQTGGQWYSDTSPFSIPWPGFTYGRHLRLSKYFYSAGPGFQCLMMRGKWWQILRVFSKITFG
jgi:hypothetical protein